VPSIAVDAGPLVTLFDRGDAHHGEAMAFFRTTSAGLVTNVAVMTEAAHLLSFSRMAMKDAVAWVAATFHVDRGTATDLPRIVEVLRKYDDLPADFADASLVALCERRDIGLIATFDRDFDVYRLADGKSLRNVFNGGSGAQT
jgi:hypothetical protein